MSTTAHSNDDYSVIDKAKMDLGHTASPYGLLLPGIDAAIKREATRLCARDYLENHVFFNDRHFHNHLNHHLLASFSMGASASRLQEIFDGNKPIQRPFLPPNQDVAITAENYAEYLGQDKYYPEFIDFYRRELDNAKDGDWHSVACKYIFEPQLFPRVMSGLLHPLIQIGYGLEFNSKALMAMALSQASVHSVMLQSAFEDNALQDILGSSQDNDEYSLLDILERMRIDPLVDKMSYAGEIYSAENNRYAEALTVKYAKLWSVQPTETAVMAKYEEMLAVAGLMYGSATKPGYKQVFEFAIMHCLTSSYFLPIIMDIMSPSQQAKLLRVYSIVVLFTYASKKCPALYTPVELISSNTYEIGVESSKDNKPSTNPWFEVFNKAIASDDMHVSKVVRGLWRGSLISAFSDKNAKVPEGYTLPPTINWLYLARTTVDTITISSFEDAEEQNKAGRRGWVHALVGSDEFWEAEAEKDC